MRLAWDHVAGVVHGAPSTTRICTLAIIAVMTLGAAAPTRDAHAVAVHHRTWIRGSWALVDSAPPRAGFFSIRE